MFWWKNDVFIWWDTWININHGVWYFVYWITILSLQFSLGLTLSKALFNFCKICLSCLILPMKLVVFTLTKSHNSSLFIYLFTYRILFLAQETSKNRSYKRGSSGYKKNCISANATFTHLYYQCHAFYFIHSITQSKIYIEYFSLLCILTSYISLQM